MARCTAGDNAETAESRRGPESFPDSVGEPSVVESFRAFFHVLPEAPLPGPAASSSCRQQNWKLPERQRRPLAESALWSPHTCSALSERPFCAGVFGPSPDWTHRATRDMVGSGEADGEREPGGEEEGGGGDGEQTRTSGPSDGEADSESTSWLMAPSCDSMLAHRDWELPVVETTVAGRGRRPLHEQVAGHQVQEDPAHPVGHAVGPRRAVVDVQHEHGDDDGERDEDHGEEEVLADERDDQRRGGDDLGDEQQEDGEGQQHGDAQRDLLAALRGQVEDQHREAGDEQAGNDEVDGVEEWQPADDEVVRDVGVDLDAALVLLGVVLAHGVDDHPLAALPVVHLVHLVGHADQVDLGAVVRPRAELHLAVLLVEGEEGDVDAAGRLVDGRRRPFDVAVVEQVRLGEVRHRKVSVGAGEENPSRGKRRVRGGEEDGQEQQGNRPTGFTTATSRAMLNTGKTKELVVDFWRRKSPPIPVSINGEEVEMVDTYKFLWVHLNNKLDWSDNTEALYRKGQMCWGGGIGSGGASKLNKLVRKASPVVGMKLDCVEAVTERRMRGKLQAIMDNPSHPLYAELRQLRSTFSHRLTQPRGTDHVDELGDGQAEVDQHHVGGVGDGPGQLVVADEQGTRFPWLLSTRVSRNISGLVETSASVMEAALEEYKIILSLKRCLLTWTAVKARIGLARRSRGLALEGEVLLLTSSPQQDVAKRADSKEHSVLSVDCGALVVRLGVVEERCPVPRDPPLQSSLIPGCWRGFGGLPPWLSGGHRQGGVTFGDVHRNWLIHSYLWKQAKCLAGGVENGSGSGRRRNRDAFQGTGPYLGANPFQGALPFTKKRELFPGLPPASPGSFALPHWTPRGAYLRLSRFGDLNPTFRSTGGDGGHRPALRNGVRQSLRTD
ncbi:hypothetical protein N1851_009389 [Merluccius polli]|uniref:Uncharacterized protein n=1 Tax=Merluccius polli TaxID=89951 RepID=A0AA47N183_MERPO|nr:hypothetical protein N1851_009389 [Merluccius polli]